MTLIKSISGIRGTIGGFSGDNLTPVDVVSLSAGFGAWLKEQVPKNTKVVIGRDARPSGETIYSLVSATLRNLGVEVINLGLSTTPTVEMAVTHHEAAGGIIITASHNPQQWNALKFLNSKGEFVLPEEGQRILELGEGDMKFVDNHRIAKESNDEEALQRHIDAILQLPYVDVDAIKSKGFKVAIDAVNSSGGIAIPALLMGLGVNQIHCVYCEPNGNFPHNPEPLPENLTHICNEIENGQFDVGIVVDPDVDRLVFIDEAGNSIGEEYTLVAIADYLLTQKAGNTVSNLSSTQALGEITRKHGGSYTAAAVGEVNVVKAMKECDAVIGGEGNGGIILPDLHYGRDALVGVALFLTYLAKTDQSVSKVKSSLPGYHIAKKKVELNPDLDLNMMLSAIQEKYSHEEIITIDGVKINFGEEWVHLRKSNTEPIIRIYAESDSEAKADHLANKIISDFREILEEKV